MIARPICEDESNLVEEVKFFADLQTHKNYEHYRFRKLPISYRLDAAAISSRSNRVEGYCGLKRRSCRVRDYETLILSLKKWRELLAFSEFGWSRLFVRWDDYDGVLDAGLDGADISIDVTYSGRFDRGDWQDQEPVIHLPTKSFRLLDIERGGMPTHKGEIDSWEV